jgi:hypothetical protein
LPTNADAVGLTFVLGTELLRTRVGDALERAAILVLGAVRVVGAVAETARVGARAARSRYALLRFGTGLVQAGDETFAVDANAIVAALEVELTSERRRLGTLFERIETQTVLRAGRAEGAVVFLLAFADTAKRRAELTDAAVRVRYAQVPLRRRLRVAFVTSAKEATAFAQGSVGDTEVSGVPVTAGDPE